MRFSRKAATNSSKRVYEIRDLHRLGVYLLISERLKKEPCIDGRNHLFLFLELGVGLFFSLKNFFIFYFCTRPNERIRCSFITFYTSLPQLGTSLEPRAYFYFIFCVCVSDVLNMNYSPQRNKLWTLALISKCALFAPNFTADQAEVQPAGQTDSWELPFPSALSVPVSAQTRGPGAHRQGLRCTWSAGDARIIISLLLQHWINLQLPLFNTTAITSHNQPHSSGFRFLLTLRQELLPKGHSGCLCVLITCSYIHPRRLSRGIQFHLTTSDLFGYGQCIILMLADFIW